MDHDHPHEILRRALRDSDDRVTIGAPTRPDDPVVLIATPGEAERIGVTLLYSPTGWLAFLPGPTIVHLAAEHDVRQFALFVLDRIAHATSRLLEDLSKGGFHVRLATGKEWSTELERQRHRALQLHGWDVLPEETTAAIWGRFHAQLSKPSSSNALWPVRAWDLSQMFELARDASDIYTERELALRRLMLEGLQKYVPVGELTYALDWQHSGYAFSPHMQAVPISLGDWPVSVTPLWTDRLILTNDSRFVAHAETRRRVLFILDSCFDQELRPLLLVNGFSEIHQMDASYQV
jgi:hypothetical protein